MTWTDMTTALEEVAAWYRAQCDGDWEHHHGVSIQSTDNPGWWVKIDVRQTPLQGQPFPPVEQGVDARGLQTGAHWISCRVKDDIWHGAGDEGRLEEILSRFIAWSRLEGP